MSATVLPQVGGDFGDYRIDALLGRGAMGVVYRAWQRRMNRPVALKVLPAELADDPEYRARFAREAAALAQLDSPHVIQIYDHGDLDGHLYLAMQLVQGPDLGRLLESGVLAPRRALRIAAQVATALGDAHAVGVVHRDVKPSNVLLRARAAHDTGAEDDFAYLCDFGIARSAADVTSGPQTAGIIGTMGYLAPERLRGEAATPASDVYSLGCLLWALLIGTAPYRGSQPEVIMSHLSAPVPQLAADDHRTAMVNDLLAGTMAKNPADRPTIGTVRRQIRETLAVAGTGPVTAAASGPTSPAPAARTLPEPRRRSRRPRVWLIGLVAAAIAVVVVAWYLLADPARSADDRLRRATPAGVTCTATAVPEAAAAAGALRQVVCTVDPAAEVGELRLVALGGGVDDYLRGPVRQDPDALPTGECPADLPARTTWQRDGRSGSLFCFVLGPNTRYAWTFDDLDVVAVLDGRPQTDYPADLAAVTAFFDARYR